MALPFELRSRGASAAVVAAGFILLTVALTWPQARDPRHLVALHQDALFTIWRLAWIGHQLPRDPLRLLDGNIFFNEPGTLLLSDPILVPGLLASPFLWLGIDQVSVYNLMILAGFVLSGMGAYLLVRHLTANTLAAVVSGVIFAFAPCRFEHYFHLELLWAQWIPLGLLFLIKAVETGRLRDGLLSGSFVALQVLSCLYYGVFFVTVLGGVVPFLLLTARPKSRKGAAAALALGGVGAALVVGAYAVPFLIGKARPVDRPVEEVVRYSAQASDYLAAPAANRLYGWTADRFGRPERRLFPGVLALLLACTGVWPLKRHQICFAGILLFSLWASFGLNGGLYGWLREWIAPFRTLRVPARYAVFVLLSISVLAGYGAAKILARTSSARSRQALFAALLAILLVEYASRIELQRVAGTPLPLVYRWLQVQPWAPVVELPMPLPDRLPGEEATFQYWSTYHWYPLLNGYSGYYPRPYLDLLEQLRAFPAGIWIDALHARGARYVLVHEGLLAPAVVAEVREQLVRRMDVRPRGEFNDTGLGRVSAYEFR